jgi:recombinational DNA repair protein RecT
MARYELTEAMGGKQKVVFMDHTQLKAHRDKYAKGLQREGSVWNSSYDVACMKTVVKRLLTWHGYFEDVNTELISRLRFNDQSVELEELPAQVTEESEVLVGHILSADEHLPLNIQHETPLPVEWRK